ncbi:MAG: hypothetical protein ACI9VR_000463 [Cognaticolwellia sp.]|jgi:hypothetical protein
MTLDTALLHYQATHPLWDAGTTRNLVNHGPMASEALEALGRLDALPALQAAYVPELLQPWWVPTGLARPEHLGRYEDLAQWSSFYMSFEDPIALLQAELPALLPGVLGASLHGLLRVAHGLRAWHRQPSEPRRREVAFGLALWAGGFRTLPGQVGSGDLDLVQALETLPSIPPNLKREGLITDRVLAVWDWPAFQGHLAQIALPKDPSAAISQLTAWAARRYLVEDQAGFAYLHALTASASLRTLLPILDPDSQRAALAALIQALLAMELTHRSTSATARPGSPSSAGLVDKAIEIANDHGIKYVEAVLTEERIEPRPERVAAAWRTLGKLAG